MFQGCELTADSAPSPSPGQALPTPTVIASPVYFTSPKASAALDRAVVSALIRLGETATVEALHKVSFPGARTPSPAGNPTDRLHLYVVPRTRWERSRPKMFTKLSCSTQS